jgi:hypothetical protein
MGESSPAISLSRLNLCCPTKALPKFSSSHSFCKHFPVAENVGKACPIEPVNNPFGNPFELRIVGEQVFNIGIHDIEWFCGLDGTS